MKIKSSVDLKAIISCIMFLLSFSALASEPNADVLKNFMSFELPSGWNVVDIRINNSTNFGTEENPFYKQKFTAKLAPSTPLYIHQKWLGGTEVISLYASADEPISANGIASSQLKNERWTSKFEFEGKPFEAGKPINSFSSSAVLNGSAEEEAALDKMNAEKVAQDRAKADAEAKKRAEKAKAERKESEKRIRFQNLVAKYNATESPKKIEKDPRFELRAGAKYYLIVDARHQKRLGFCWGAGKYRTISSIAAAAINSGALNIGEKAIIEVSVIKHGDSFGTLTANGVRCADHSGKKALALTFRKIHDVDYNEI